MRAGLAAVVAVLFMWLGFSIQASAADMTFRAEPVGGPGSCRHGCPKVIVADGVITRRTPPEFLRFVRDNLHDKSFRNVIFIDSAGGSVSPAIQLGLLFRKLGSTVIVAQVESSEHFGNDPRVGVPLSAGGCYSACLFALMGGKIRIVPEASVVGVHRIHTRGQIDVASSDKHMMYTFAETDLVEAMRGYARTMGVNPDVITLAESVQPTDIHRLTDDEIKRYKLARRRF